MTMMMMMAECDRQRCYERQCCGRCCGRCCAKKTMLQPAMLWAAMLWAAVLRAAVLLLAVVRAVVVDVLPTTALLAVLPATGSIAVERNWSFLGWQKPALRLFWERPVCCRTPLQMPTTGASLLALVNEVPCPPLAGRFSCEGRRG